nr:elongation factor-like GTPase 1 [Tanacetum cinerariifolium]
VDFGTQLTPLEVYAKLLRIVREVNGIVNTYKNEKYLSNADSIIQSVMGEMGDEGIEFIEDDKEDTVAHGSKARPMFVQFVLEQLWQVYEATLDTNDDKGILEKLIKSFNLSILPRELQNKDLKVVLQSVMNSDVVKSDVIAEAELVRKSFEACVSRPESPCVAFVSKMFTVPIKMLPQQDINGDIINNYHEESGSGDSDECFLAFVRVLSKHIQEAELHSLYLMMGQGLKPIATTRAGNIVAIKGLGQHILKSATLASTKNSWSFLSMTFQVSPTLNVAIEPSDPIDIAALMKGLRLLNHADPFVEISVSARGEYVLAAIGEVHLERCIKDLKDRIKK